ncbi:MAG TPA: hypothetical protein VKR30_06175 [Candidatus Limnocylindrales bacterium]|nr:hypothetical protein [Candidatus Limnocylindrales bacterium]
MTNHVDLVERPRGGVVFVEPWHAIVARSGEAAPVTLSLSRTHETSPEFLGRVARELEDCDRLVVMGTGVDRLAFEREYVTLYQRPERLVHDESVASATRFDVLDRLDRLVS